MLNLSSKIASVQKSQTLLLTAQAKTMRDEGIDVVSLTAGEPDFPTPAHIKQAAIKAIEENFTKYTPSQGIPELCKAIAEKFRRDNNLSFDPLQILVSCGAKHSIYNALQAICNDDDEVIIVSPYWVSYPDMVKLVGAVPRIIETDEAANFKVSPQQLQQAISKKTKALLFNSPCNPTGTVYNKEEIEELAEIVLKANLYVISDEIYEKVIYDGAAHFSMGALKKVRDQVITVNGVSKAYSMTGWRIGYFGANREVYTAAEKVQSQITSNASSISQRAALAALTGPDTEQQTMVKEFRRRRDYICKELQDIIGLSCRVPEGAFYIFPRVSSFYGKSFCGKKIADSDELCQFLLVEQKVATVPGSAFGADEYIRLSFACSMEELQKAVQRLKEGFEKLR